MLFIMNIMTFVVVTLLIVKPLSVYMKCIRDKMRLEITGAYEFKYFAMTYNDIYELNAANQAMLMHKATHDPLTGIMNRGAFESLKDFLKQSSKPMALLLVDIDHFKSVNDTYGHNSGDEVLTAISEIIRENIPETACVCRWGGEEILILASGTPLNGAMLVAERIRAHIEDMEVFCEEHTIKCLCHRQLFELFRYICMDINDLNI